MKEPDELEKSPEVCRGTSFQAATRGINWDSDRKYAGSIRCMPPEEICIVEASGRDRPRKLDLDRDKYRRKTDTERRATAESFMYSPNYRNDPQRTERNTLKTSKSTNILLLGEAETGKTTFINGLANYLEHKTLQSMIETTPRLLTDVAFTLSDENHKRRRLKLSANYPSAENTSSAEQLNEQGEAVTQSPKVYTLNYKNDVGETKTLNIVDTPGMSDIREEKGDKENFEKILSNIRDLGDLHAICIVMKPNKTQFSLSFQYAIQYFLTLLPPDAVNNVLFCFTNTRSTFTAGDTLATLQSYLDKLEKWKGITIKADKSNIFCVDNACFRYALAVEDGINVRAEELDCMFNESWEWNVKECRRLLTKAENIPAVSVANILNITQTQELVTMLAKPLVEMARDHLLKMRTVEDCIKQIKDVHKQMSSLERQIEVVDKRIPEDYHDITQRTQKLIEKEKEKYKSLEFEHDAIQHFGAEAALFLMENESTDDPFLQQIENLVQKEERNAKLGGDSVKYYELSVLLEQYKNKVISLKADVEEKKRFPTNCNELLRKVNGLTTLPYCGEQVKQLRVTLKRTSERSWRRTTQIADLPSETTSISL